MDDLESGHAVGFGHGWIVERGVKEVGDGVFAGRLIHDRLTDVNDLGRVKVLASSRGCNEDLLQRALKPNPAGNANERTPLVLVRPA